MRTTDSAMSGEGLKHEDHGAVRVIFLNRLPSNVLNLAFLDLLGKKFDEGQADPNIRCIVLASALPKYFSSGLDLNELCSLPMQDQGRLFHGLIGAHRKIASVSKPTVAAIEGYALLGGFILSLACDWRYMARETGRVALAEVQLGLSPTTGLIRLICSLNGRPGLIKDLILRGQTLKAQEALEGGLVDHLLPREDFLNAVLKEAGRLSKMAPAAYASIKRTLRNVMMPNENELWQQSIREVSEILSGSEAQEGILARKGKRRPRWE